MHFIASKAIRLTMILSLALLASACVSKKELMALKENEATVVLNARVTMDGNADTKFAHYCRLLFRDKNHEFIKNDYDNETGYYVLKAEAGRIEVEKIWCSANKFFYNKNRIYPIKDLYLIAEAGKINYAGDLKVEWESERFKVGDLFFTGIGDIMDDHGFLRLRLVDRFEEAEAYTKKNYPAADTMFVKSLFKDHELLTK